MNWRSSLGLTPNRKTMPIAPMAFVILTVGLLTFLAWNYIEHRLSEDLSLTASDQGIVIALSFFSALAVPLGLLATSFPRNTILRPLTIPGLFLMGLTSSLLVLTIARDFALSIYFSVSSAPAVYMLTWSAQWTIILALIFSFLGLYNAKSTPKLKTIEIPIKGLRQAVRGFRIAHLTDVHVGPTIGAKDLTKMVSLINATNPDVIVITGDLVDGRLADLEKEIRPLFDLRSVYGVYFVTGNHEYYSGCQDWIDHLSSNGITVLLNEHKIITHMGARIAIAGVTDHKAHNFIPHHQCDPEKALSGIPSNTPTILLAHQPITAGYVPSEKVSLQLSGHTHGGQFFPWRYAVPLQQPVISGLSNKYGHLMYVSRGAGYWGPPKRIAAASEITLVTLMPHE